MNGAGRGVMNLQNEQMGPGNINLGNFLDYKRKADLIWSRTPFTSQRDMGSTELAKNYQDTWNSKLAWQSGSKIACWKTDMRCRKTGCGSLKSGGIRREELQIFMEKDRQSAIALLSVFRFVVGLVKTDGIFQYHKYFTGTCIENFLSVLRLTKGAVHVWTGRL